MVGGALSTRLSSPTLDGAFPFPFLLSSFTQCKIPLERHASWFVASASSTCIIFSHSSSVSRWTLSLLFSVNRIPLVYLSYAFYSSLNSVDQPKAKVESSTAFGGGESGLI